MINLDENHMFYGDTQLNSTIHQSSNILKQIADTFFNARSILILAGALIIGSLAGRIAAALLRRLTKTIGKRADKTKDLGTVNRLRRFETLIVLSIALLRTFLIILALYFWWVYTHPGQQPTAIIGASALFALVLGGVLGPLLRDVAYGSVMMAEHWFGVSDHITIQPFALQGVVERVTLRSTKIRSLNGEVVWVNNQNIAAVQIAPKGIRTLALELFVSDVERGEKLVEATNLRLPIGPLMVVSPLSVMTKLKTGANVWHITVVGETAPERQWLLDKVAIQIIQELDEKSKHKILLNEPVARYADTEAERRFARTINNSRKVRIKKSAIPYPKRSHKIRKIQ